VLEGLLEQASSSKFLPLYIYTFVVSYIGRTGRSISFADEDHRKVIREIIRYAREPVKNRVIAQAVIDKYKRKVEELSGTVKGIIAEEGVEKQISFLENRANKLKNRLTGKGQEVSIGKNKSLKAGSRGGKKLQKVNNDIVTDYVSRGAKRAKRPKKIRTVVE
jgi:hypothetical protein